MSLIIAAPAPRAHRRSRSSVEMTLRPPRYSVIDVASAASTPACATATAANGAGHIPWVKTPIYLITQEEMPEFVCSHQHWLNVDEVYKNVPDQKPTC